MLIIIKANYFNFEYRSCDLYWWVRCKENLKKRLACSIECHERLGIYWMILMIILKWSYYQEVG